MATFATLTDLAVRLGHAGEADLTAAQRAQGTLLLEIATGLVTDAVDRDQVWADALAPVPAVLRAVTLEAVARVMQNPSGVRSESQQLGSAQHQVTYTDHAHGLALTPAEVMLCRRTVWGLTGSVALTSFVTPIEEPTV